MITGTKFHKSGLLLLVFSDLILGTTIADADSSIKKNSSISQERHWTLDELHRLLSKHSKRYADFEEIHFSSILAEPVKLRGRLIYIAPDKIEKHVIAPYEERYSVDDDVVLFENQAKGISHTMSLKDYPLLQVFVDGLRATFAGDFNAVARFYDIRLEGSRHKWMLMLVPIEEHLRDRIESITIQGQEDEVKQLDLRETTGDYSQIRVKVVR